MQPNMTNSNNDGFVPDNPSSDDGFVPDGFVADQPSQGKPQDWISKVYTPVIEGAAMTAGGAAGAVMGAPAGPIGAGLGGAGMAAAMFPPAKRFAASIDQMRGIENPVNQPKPLFSQAKEVASDTGEGLAIEAGGRALSAGTEVAAPYAKSIFRGAAKKMSKAGSFVSGAKPQDLMTAYDQGLVKTYGAPSMEKAGNIFESAAEKAGANAPKSLESIIDPDLSQARDTALAVTKKLRAGEQLTAQEALDGRQAIDYIREATPMKAKKKLKMLGDLRDEVQGALTDISPELQDASKTYRQAIVKSNLSKPWPVNKNGTPSKLLPAINAAGSIFASGAAHNPAILGTAIAYPVATSPLAAGIGAAVSGDVARGVGSAINSSMGQKILTAALARDYLRKANGDRAEARIKAKQDGYVWEGMKD